MKQALTMSLINYCFPVLRYWTILAPSHTFPSLSAEFYPAQPVAAQPVHAGPEWGDRQELLVDHQPRWREEWKGTPAAGRLHGQQ